MKGLLFWGNLGARCGNIEAKIFQSLACLGKDFQVTSPPKNICVSVYQMLSLKCADTSASFSARRPEIVQGHIHVLVHKYKKSTDWPLAWTALQNTRDVYEKRVREFLDDSRSTCRRERPAGKRHCGHLESENPLRLIKT